MGKTAFDFPTLTDKIIGKNGGEAVLDICHSDEIAKALQVTCLSSQYGRYVFKEEGTYTIEIQLRVNVPFKSLYIQMDVRFDPQQPLNLERLGSVRQSRSQPKALLAG